MPLAALQPLWFFAYWDRRNAGAAVNYGVGVLQ